MAGGGWAEGVRGGELVGDGRGAREGAVVGVLESAAWRKAGFFVDGESLRKPAGAVQNGKGDRQATEYGLRELPDAFQSGEAKV